MTDFRNAKECMHLTYEETKDMSIDDAIFILKRIVDKYHSAETEEERIWLPRARMIRIYEIAIKEMEKNKV